MPEVILKNLPFLLSGLRLTAEIALWSILGGTALGLVIGAVRHLRVPVLAQLFALYVGFVRGTPLLVMLFICYFGLPALLSYKTGAYGAAVLGFILFIAAYLEKTSAPACARYGPLWCRPRSPPASRGRRRCAWWSCPLRCAT